MLRCNETHDHADAVAKYKWRTHVQKMKIGTSDELTV